jgi:hypothetical protein
MFLDPEPTSDYFLNHAMPLIGPPLIADRLATYGALSPMCRLETTERTIGFNTEADLVEIQAMEHQFIFDLTLAPDQQTQDAFENDHKMARAMFSGVLHFWNYDSLHFFGWDHNAIFGPVSNDQKYAFVLTNAWPGDHYHIYMPHSVSALYRAFYVNIEVDNSLLTSLITAYVSETYGRNRTAEYELDTGNWVDDYLTLFLNHNEPIPVNANASIGPILQHAASSDEYRLSMFFLGRELEDFTPNVHSFFDYYQRQPFFDVSQSNVFIGFHSLAGHPLIQSFNPQKAVEAARVDILNQDTFLGKHDDIFTDYLELDWEAHPEKLVVQNPPQTPLAGPAAVDVDLTGHGESRFTVFNPDNVNLLVEFDPASGFNLNGLTLQFSPDAGTPPLSGSSHIIPGDPVAEMLVICTQAKSSQQQLAINISQLDDLLQNPILLRQIELHFLDFKLLPLHFWELRGGTPTTPNLYGQPQDLTSIISIMNQILGKQANIFTYSVNRDNNNNPWSQPLDSPQADQFALTFLYDTFADRVNFISSTFDGVLASPTSRVNVVWLPLLPGDQETRSSPMEKLGTAWYPSLLVRLRIGSTGPDPDNPLDHYSQDHFAKVIIHELGHYVPQCLANLAGDSNYDYPNYVYPGLDTGHSDATGGEDESFNNIFYRGYGEKRIHITVNQARFLNDNTDLFS